MKIAVYKKMATGIAVHRSLILVLVFAMTAVVSFVAGNGSIIVVGSWISNAVPLLILAMAAAVVLSSGQVDIATGAVMSFLGMTMVFILGIFDTNVEGFIILHVIICVMASLIYYAVYQIVQMGVASLIVTLSLYFIMRGLSTFLQICLQNAGFICRAGKAGLFHSTSGVLPSRYVVGEVGSLAFSIVLILVVTFSIYVWRFHTHSGLNHVAVGMNPMSARFVGVSAPRVYRTAFMIAGVLVALATIVRIHGQTHGGWSANTGWGEELLAISIAVIGGTRIAGGRLDPISVALAALVVYSLRDVVTNDLSLPAELASIAFGVAMIIVVVVDVRNRGR